MVIDSPYYSVYEELASPEQTATGKDVSNPLYGCDSLPKTVRVFQFTLDSRSEKLDWLLLHQVSAACRVAAGYIVSAGLCCCCLLCSCCSSILLIREDLSRNLELTESKPIVPADYVSAGHVLVPAGSSSNVPADYVSAGHVLVPADRDRIC
ncbi:hypothetical protein Tco_0056570 [Tanacetum coccineum]